MADIIIYAIAALIALSVFSMISSVFSDVPGILSPPSAKDIARETDRIAKRERYQKLLNQKELSDTEAKELDELLEFFSKNKLY